MTATNSHLAHARTPLPERAGLIAGYLLITPAAVLASPLIAAGYTAGLVARLATRAALTGWRHAAP